MDSPPPFSLSLFLPASKGKANIHLAVSLSVERHFDPANQNKMTSSLHSPFKIIYYSLYPA
jgi:hypothetical protein